MNLEEISEAEGSSVDLNEIVRLEQAPTAPLPQSAMRTRAATVALLQKNPSQAVQSYQTMMMEGQQGSQDTLMKLQEGILKDASEVDTRSLMNLLGDSSVPFETKQKVVGNFVKAPILKDSGVALLTEGLAAPSKNETVEAEDARINTSELVNQIYEERVFRQGIQNAHGASLPDVGADTLAEMTALWVVPFGNNVSTGRVAGEVNKLTDKPSTLFQTIKSYLMPGSTKMELVERLRNMPPQARQEFVIRLRKAIETNSGIIFGDDNQFAEYQHMEQILTEGAYTNTDKWLDNLSPILDLFGVGQVLRGGKKAITQEQKAIRAATRAEESIPATVHSTSDKLPAVTRKGAEIKEVPTGVYEIKPGGQIEEIKRIEVNSVVRKEQPSAPAMIVQQSNPQQARALHATMAMAPTDEAAQALYGVTKEQALVNDTFPQLATEHEAVTSKIADIERELRNQIQTQENVRDMLGLRGATFYTEKELRAAETEVMRDFQHAEGLVPIDAMSSFKREGAQIKISTVYGTPEGSFVNAKEAMDQVLFAGRKFGLTKEDVQILRKEGLDHIPVKFEDVENLDGNYLIKINAKYDIDPTDIVKYEQFDVKRNFIDRVSPWLGKFITSPARWLFDAASMLHPVYTGAASVASDVTAKFDKMMLDLASDYAEQYNKLSKARKDKVDLYIREANYQGIKYDPADLVAQGFTQEEITALASWRKFWDAHFYLENYDVVRSLNAQGYGYFKNQNAELYAKPIAKNQNIGALYDPSTDSVVLHTKADGDALYNTGGTYAKLRRPIDVGGTTVEHMIVRNTPQEYVRKFTDNDMVMNYRDGYFQIQYTAPKFIDEIQPDGTRKAVAVGGDVQEAEAFRTRMARLNPANEYKVRSDDRMMQRGSDDWWDVHSARGRIAQRHRGKLLEDSSGLNHLGDGSYILNPVESAIRAAKSIAGRTVSRPMLEASKARAISQYKDYFPGNGMGGKRWPKTIDEIGAKGEFFTGELADARTTWEYINYLENGYLNNMDVLHKGVFNLAADMLGKYKLPGERALRQVGEVGPGSTGKNAVFFAYIGSNFIRQFVVQSHQIVRTWAYNPKGWINGNVTKYIGEYLGDLSGLGKKTDFSEWLDKTGLMDAVDKNNLVRGVLADAADSSNKVTRIVGKAVALPRRIGFDTGEQANLLGHAAAVYDRYKSAGKNMADPRVMDDALSEVRAISYDMNFAGDMPYNQTTPSVILQFMQVPHKAFLQMTNRRIPVDVRMRLIAGDVLMWGTPAALIGDFINEDILPDDPKMREIVMYGLESHMMNSFLTWVADEEVKTDFSSLAPYDMTGWAKFFQAMYTGGAHQMIMNSPAGQLFLSEGSRVQNAVGAMGRYFGAFEELDQEDPETFLSMVNEIGKISSGWSNATKAYMAIQSGKFISKSGDVIDPKVNSVEAVAQVFGFGTETQRDLYEILHKANKNKKAYEEDLKKDYEHVKRYYIEKLSSDNIDQRFITKVTGYALMRYRDDPEAMKKISQWLDRDFRSEESNLLYLLMKGAQIPSYGDIEADINRAPLEETQKQQLLEYVRTWKDVRTDMKEKK